MSKITFPPAGRAAGALLPGGPERGWRTHLYWYVDAALAPDDMALRARYGAWWCEGWRTAEEYWERMFAKFFSTGTDRVDTCFVYIYLTAYHDQKQLPPQALAIIEQFFAYVRKKRITILLDFCYCDNFQDLSTCADEETMLAHMAQLSPIVRRNADVIHCIKEGFCGAFGEWAYQHPPVDHARVTRGIVESFCDGTGLCYLARLPQYKSAIGRGSRFARRIGFANDAVYGEQTRKNWHSGGFQLGTPAWEQVSRECAYAPNDGEMCTNYAMTHYHNDETGGTGIIPYGIDVIAEAAHHRFSTLSIWHGCHDYQPQNEPLRIMDEWKKQPVTPALLTERQVVFDPDWFSGDDCSCFAFLRDHLGYRIVLQEAELSADGTIVLRLKNYGFSAAFRMQSGFALLDERFDPLIEASCGDPETWVSHDPEDPRSVAVPTYTLTACLPRPADARPVYAAFYLRNALSCYASVANAVPTVGGYVLLGRLPERCPEACGAGENGG